MMQWRFVPIRGIFNYYEAQRRGFIVSTPTVEVRMEDGKLRSPARALIKAIGAAVIVLVPMSVQIGPGNEAQAVSGGPTGWCTDHSGRNFRCGSTSSPSTGGGGGCAHAGGGGVSRAQETQQTANFENSRGVKAYNNGDYVNAATRFEHAYTLDPGNATMKRNFGNALNKLGLAAANRGEYENAYIYFLRAADHTNMKAAHDNVRILRDRLGGRQVDCRMCSKAYLSDVKYGLQQSANFTNYAAHATSNFSNCKKRTSENCMASAGQHLYDVLVQACTDRLMTGGEGAYKACIRQAHADAERQFNR